MDAPSRSLLTYGLLASVVCITAGAWLLRSVGDGGGAQANPALVDLLGPGTPAPAVNPRAARPPLPPQQAAWTSPLAERCLRPDLNELRRLRRAWQDRSARSSQVTIHPDNYGERLTQDAYGQPIPHRPSLVVLHETVYGLNSALQTFRTPHPNDADQVSYHALISLDGRIVRLLDPERRAFGAGYSAFNRAWLVTNPKVGGSINNVALHVSLETPLDGEHDGPAHSGYRPAQYDALALLLAEWMRRYGIPAERITTHQYVDLGGERSDPRSFDWVQLGQRLAALGLAC